MVVGIVNRVLEKSEMDTRGYLRNVTEEELRTTMEDLLHPVDSIADVPEWKQTAFRRIDKGINLAARKRIAKKNKVDWAEYMIWRSL